MKIGIIGVREGGIGRNYAQELARAGHTVLVYDNKPSAMKGLIGGNIFAHKSAASVLREADATFYATPITTTPNIIRETVEWAKPGSIVGGFTSVKHHEVAAFREKAPGNVSIVSIHPLHAPVPRVTGHTVAVVPVRATSGTVAKVEGLFKKLGNNIFRVAPEEHDKVMADTQALTHFIFLSMALAWKMRRFRPEDSRNYANSIDALKADMALRILHMNPTVYAGIAILNPHVRPQIEEYVKVLNEISRNVRTGNAKKLRLMWHEAAAHMGKPQLKAAGKLAEEVLTKEYDQEKDLNSQISLLAMGLTWKRLGINPHAVAFQTPPYKIRSLLVQNVLSRPPARYVENALKARMKQDDLAFIEAANIWERVIKSGSIDRYNELFEKTREFFGVARTASAKKRTDEIVANLAAVRRI